MNKHISILNITILATILTISLARGLDSMHEWALSNWWLSYDMGFIKRGLPGSVIDLIQDLTSTPDTGRNDIIGAAAWLILLLEAGCLLYIGKEIISRNHNSGWAICLVSAYMASPAITMTSNLIGYYDHIITIFCIMALLLCMQSKVLTAGLVTAGSMLVHETTLTNTLPLLILCITAIYIQDQTTTLQKYTKAILMVSAPAIIVFIFLLINQQSLIDEDIKTNIIKKLSSNLPQNTERATYYANMLTYPFNDYLREELPKFWGRITDSTYLTSIAPFLFTTYCLVWKAINPFRFRAALYLIFILASIAPLSLHLIAFDTERIWCMPITSTLIALWILSHFGYLQPVAHDYRFFTQLFLILLVYYCTLRPFGMMPADIQLFTSDLVQLYGLPILYLCWVTSRPFPKASTNDT